MEYARMRAGIQRFLVRRASSSLFGGLYFDSKASRFINTAHLYLFLLFVLVPFALSVIASPFVASTIWGCFISVFFLLTLTINRFFQRLFDRQDGIFNSPSSSPIVDLEELKSASVALGGSDKKSASSDEDEELRMATASEHSLVLDLTGAGDVAKDEGNGCNSSQDLSAEDEAEGGGSQNRGSAPSTVSSGLFIELNEEKEDVARAVSSDLGETSESMGEESTSNRKSSRALSAEVQPKVHDVETVSSLSDPLDMNDVASVDVEPESRLLDRSLVKRQFGVSPTDFVIYGHRLAVPFSRIDLEMLFDRKYSLPEMFGSVIAATVLAVVSFWAVDQFSNFSLLWFWFVIATGHYSLLKAPQPDASSPHAFARSNAFSRSFYLSILCISVATLTNIAAELPQTGDSASFVFYERTINVPRVIRNGRTFGVSLISSMPFIQLVGILPQPMTFIVVLLEQINLHVLGGSGIHGFWSGVYEVVKVSVVMMVCYAVGLYPFMNGLFENNIVVSFFYGLLTGLCFLLSRSSPNPMDALSYFGQGSSIRALPFRLVMDVLFGLIYVVGGTCLHITMLFRKTDPYLFIFLMVVSIVIGFCNHVVLLSIKSPNPFNLLRHPFFTAGTLPENIETGPLLPTQWHEFLFKIVVWIEKFLVFPLLCISSVSVSAPTLASHIGPSWALFVSILASVRFLRGSFADVTYYHIIVAFVYLYFEFDIGGVSEGFVVDFFLGAYVFFKFEEIVEKIAFMCLYTVPWNWGWGSALHAIIQPLAVAHTMFYLVEIVVSSVLSAPIFPVIGSAICLVSYPRPIKYWEKDYKSSYRKDADRKLAVSLGVDLLDETNHFDALFYEHMYLSLQRSLCDHVTNGRLGKCLSGDFFILVDNDRRRAALLHIVAVGNGHCSFQLRGLEWRATLCHENELRSVEELMDPSSIDNNKLFGTCANVHHAQVLPFRQMFNMLWYTWGPVNRKLPLLTYDISLFPAGNLLKTHDLRCSLLKFFTQALIYSMSLREDLSELLENSVLKDPEGALGVDVLDDAYVDADPSFVKRDQPDYDDELGGLSVHSFFSVFGDWIQHCVEQRVNKGLKRVNVRLSEDASCNGEMSERRTSLEEETTSEPEEMASADSKPETSRRTSSGANSSKDFPSGMSEPEVDDASHAERSKSKKSLERTSDPIEDESGCVDERTRYSAVVRLCYAFSVLGRRYLYSSSPGKFLHCLYMMGRGDVRISSASDDWLFTDVKVIVDGVRMGLQLQNESVAFMEEFDDMEALYRTIEERWRTRTILPESHRDWYSAILHDQLELVTLRQDKGMTPEDTEHWMIRLNLAYVTFKVIKVNRESVRGFWAGQQHELVFLENQNSERGSIQQMAPTVRNLITQSCDLPIGYPIYVSPVTTSYSTKYL